MRRAITDSIVGAVCASALVALAISVRPGDRELALDIYVLALGGLAMLSVSRVARIAQRSQAGPSEFDEAMATQTPTTERPAELVRLEREVALAAARAFDLHFKLRPILREIADHRLESRRGIAPDADRSAARPLLGDPAWELLREHRPAPENRMAPGMSLADLRSVVDSLEKI